MNRKPWAKGANAPARLSGRRGVDRRARWLREYPLCVTCETQGCVTIGTEVDHLIALAKGGPDHEGNFQTLCRACHDAKSLHERGMTAKPNIGIDGVPRGWK